MNVSGVGRVICLCMRLCYSSDIPDIKNAFILSTERCVVVSFHVMNSLISNFLFR